METMEMGTMAEEEVKVEKRKRGRPPKPKAEKPARAPGERMARGGHRSDPDPEALQDRLRLAIENAPGFVSLRQSGEKAGMAHATIMRYLLPMGRKTPTTPSWGVLVRLVIELGLDPLELLPEGIGNVTDESLVQTLALRDLGDLESLVARSRELRASRERA